MDKSNVYKSSFYGCCCFRCHKCHSMEIDVYAIPMKTSRKKKWNEKKFQNKRTDRPSYQSEYASRFNQWISVWFSMFLQFRFRASHQNHNHNRNNLASERLLFRQFNHLANCQTLIENVLIEGGHAISIKHEHEHEMNGNKGGKQIHIFIAVIFEDGKRRINEYDDICYVSKCRPSSSPPSSSSSFLLFTIGWRMCLCVCVCACALLNNKIISHYLQWLNIIP